MLGFTHTLLLPHLHVLGDSMELYYHIFPPLMEAFFGMSRTG